MSNKQITTNYNFTSNILKKWIQNLKKLIGGNVYCSSMQYFENN